MWKIIWVYRRSTRSWRPFLSHQIYLKGQFIPDNPLSYFYVNLFPPISIYIFLAKILNSNWFSALVIWYNKKTRIPPYSPLNHFYISEPYRIFMANLTIFGSDWVPRLISFGVRSELKDLVYKYWICMLICSFILLMKF